MLLSRPNVGVQGKGKNLRPEQESQQALGGARPGCVGEGSCLGEMEGQASCVNGTQAQGAKCNLHF